MTGKPASCWGCAHRRTRLRVGKAGSWCIRYHTIPTARCDDYIFTNKATAQAMAYYKRISIK